MKVGALSEHCQSLQQALSKFTSNGNVDGFENGPHGQSMKHSTLR